MTARTDPWPAGTPNWVDLSTSDREASWDFYRAVMGWNITDSGDEYGNYGMADVRGLTAAGIAQQQPDAAGQPAHWTTYLASDNADATAAAITEAGGTVAFGPMDVPGQGRMLVAVDPTGASFGVWQAAGHIGAQLVNEPGGLVWNQLATPDLEAAKTFYAKVFGYTYSDAGSMATIDGPGAGGTIGGLGPLEEGNPEASPQWFANFSVADTDAAVAAAATHGGSVVFGPVDTEWGRMATIRDPQGADFGIMGASAPDPDESASAADPSPDVR